MGMGFAECRRTSPHLRQRGQNRGRLNDELGRPDDPATEEVYKFLERYLTPQVACRPQWCLPTIPVK